MKKMLIFISVSLLVLMQQAQAQYGKYIIRLKDKNNTPYSLNNPSAFLSAKAIVRRDRQHISIDSTDLPE